MHEPLVKGADIIIAGDVRQQDKEGARFIGDTPHASRTEGRSGEAEWR